MIDLICLGVINALFIWGIHATFQKGKFLNGFGKVIERVIGTTWIKPLFACPACMSSVWGASFFVVFHGIAWIIIPYCICLCGLNFIIDEYLYPNG